MTKCCSITKLDRSLKLSTKRPHQIALFIFIFFYGIGSIKSGGWKPLDNPRKDILPERKFFNTFPIISIPIGQTTTPMSIDIPSKSPGAEKNQPLTAKSGTGRLTKHSQQLQNPKHSKLNSEPSRTQNGKSDKVVDFSRKSSSLERINQETSRRKSSFSLQHTRRKSIPTPNRQSYLNDWKNRVRIGGPSFQTIAPFGMPEDVNDFGEDQAEGPDNFFRDFDQTTPTKSPPNRKAIDRKPPILRVDDRLKNSIRQPEVRFEDAFRDPFEDMAPGNTVKEVSAMCDLRTGTMDVSLGFGDPYDGEIYTKGNYKVPQCKVLGNGASKHINMRIPFESCGVEYEKQSTTEIFAVTLIVKMERLWPVISMFDKSYRLTCDSSFEDSEKSRNSTETYGVTVPMGPTEVVPTKKRISIPDTFMKVISGKDLQSSGTNLLLLGGVGTVIIISQDNTDYDLFVTECFAHDGMKMSDVDLIDPNGCPAHKKIAGFVRYSKDIEPGKTYAYFHFKIFKFPDTTNVFFSCKVQLCLNACPRPICINPASGKETNKNAFRVEREDINPTVRILGSDPLVPTSKNKRSLAMDYQKSLTSRDIEELIYPQDGTKLPSKPTPSNASTSFYKQLSNFIQVIFDDGDEKDMQHELKAEKLDRERSRVTSQKRHSLVNQTTKLYQNAGTTQPVIGVNPNAELRVNNKVCFNKNFVGVLSIVIPTTLALLFFVCIYVSIKHKRIDK